MNPLVLIDTALGNENGAMTTAMHSRRARADAAGSRTAGEWRGSLLFGCVAFAASVAALAYATTAGKGLLRFNDFYREALPAYTALTHGHLLGFLRLAPTYVGSLVLRAPFAVIPSIWGGGPRAIYFASALPCMLALAAFCTWLAAQPRKGAPAGRAARVGVVVLCIFNPITLVALFGGHPEEVLGAVLCVAAVVLAVRGKPGWAGFLVALAVVNKSWALVAVPVVFAVMPTPRRRALITFAMTLLVVLGPIMVARLHGAGTGVSASVTAAGIGGIFNPPQLLWWFGSHAWIVQESRALIVAVAIAFGASWWFIRGRGTPTGSGLSQALLLLTLVFLARAALDPWNNLYYHVPFLFALIAYESSRGRMPLLTSAYTLLLLLVVPLSGVLDVSRDTHAALYAVVVLPTFAWMVAKLYLPGGFASAQRGGAGDSPSASSSRSHSQPTDRSSTPIAAATLSHIP